VSGAAYLVADHVRVTLADRLVVTDASFALPRGSLTALVGPNGAGKTTLLRALCGLVPAAGIVRIDNDMLENLPVRERARRFAYLPQGHVVHWPLPVRDVVALGRFPHGATDPSRLPPGDAEAVERAMRATDIVDLADRRVTEISGGERSRAIVARVLAVEAPVILADEPTASLDPRHQIEVMRLLRDAADGGTLVIVVTHDLGLAARFADTVIVMQAGRLARIGPPAQALSPNILAEVFQVDAFRGEWKGEPVIVPWTTA
jgi:iron complex transport system ATP-binding protein